MLFRRVIVGYSLHRGGVVNNRQTNVDFSATATSDLCYGTVVLSVCPLSVALVYCGQTVGWSRIPFGTEVGLGQATLC